MKLIKEVKRKTKIEIQKYCKKNIIYSIIFYKVLVSPLLGRNCRFYPTCSDYSIEAINKYGIIKGILISIRRICSCNPWNRGGYDPVK